MKKAVIFILACWLIALSGVRAGAGETLVLAADNWCPYNCDPASDRPGYVVELARAIFHERSIAVDYQQISWSRSLQLVRTGQVSGLIGVTPREAPELVFPQEPVGISHNSYWTLKSSRWRFNGPRSLDNLQVGVIQHYDYGEPLNTYLNDPANSLHIQWLSGPNALVQNLKKLAASRVDVVVEDEAVVRYMARKTGLLERFRLAGVERSARGEDDVYLAFSSRDPHARQHARTLDAGIRALRRSGELARILARYGLRDWRSQGR